jgi:hypothetical protein
VKTEERGEISQNANVIGRHHILSRSRGFYRVQKISFERHLIDKKLSQLNNGHCGSSIKDMGTAAVVVAGQSVQ